MLTRARTSSTVALFFLLSWGIPVRADLTKGSETVTGDRGPNWKWSYIRSFDGTTVKKDVQIDFQFAVDCPGSEHQKLEWMKAVEANIENQWNNKYKIKGSDGKTYGAQVDVTFDGPFNQTVKVDPGENGVDGKRSSINLWHWGDGAGINAHEFGHMLGLFDEYTGGWLDPSQSPPLIDDKALMGRGCLGKNPTMPERYYTQFSDYLHKLNDGYTFTLVTIPAPAGVLLGIIGLGLVSRVNRRAA